MSMEDSRPKKRLTSVGVICELAKTRSQESYLYGIQSKSILDLDLDPPSSSSSNGSGDSAADTATERRILSAIALDLVEFPERFNKDKRETRQGIDNLREKIRRLQIMADNVQKYDIKTYRECVLDIESTITDLHNNNQLTLGKLKFDHMDIVAVIPEPADLLREESKIVKRRAPRPMPTINRRIRQRKNGQEIEEETNQPSTFDYKEIRTFDRFIQTRGGHTGGWNEEQHSIYLGLKAKYRTNLERIEEAFREILPGMDSETIKSHDDWYQEYTCLKNGRKKAIERWRDNKNVA